MARRPPVLKRRRPVPPPAVTEQPWGKFAPAPDVLEWLRAEILAADGALHNPEHLHLLDADLAVLWAPWPAEKQGRSVIGTAEEVAFRCSAWQRERQEQQMREWFGHIPDYLITLAAGYCLTCSDVEFCALVEHELYHVGQRRDAFDQPAFTKDGQPKLFIRGHDVEEFVGVVQRYGVGDPNGALARLAAAARGQPQVGRVAVNGVCGTCMLKAA